jgi:hypothetical protein
MKLKELRFETVPDIQRESQAVLDSIKENYFHGAFEGWKNDGIFVYVPKENILKEMETKLNKFSQHSFFFNLVREISDSTRKLSR